ncbi:MAG TPA: type II secretion system protein GspG [Polyangiales bacterium]
MRRRRPKTNPILLPWERENAWLGELLSGRRWRTVLLSGLVLGVVVFAYRSADGHARVRMTRAAIADADRAVAAFVAELGRCPRSTVELVHPPKTGAHYLDEVPVDGWGHPLLIRCPGQNPKDLAEAISAGPSGNFLDDDNVM